MGVIAHKAKAALLYRHSQQTWLTVIIQLIQPNTGAAFFMIADSSLVYMYFNLYTLPEEPSLSVFLNLITQLCEFISICPYWISSLILETCSILRIFHVLILTSKITCILFNVSFCKEKLCMFCSTSKCSVKFWCIVVKCSIFQTLHQIYHWNIRFILFGYLQSLH